ncbi:MAG: site-2 protease family protein [Verrucomicrobia bacterium]|nr:site-2 protease family protein [Verrucomicrobiota bacterium]
MSQVHQPQHHSPWRKWGAAIAAVGVLALKFKSVLIAAVKFLPLLLKTGGTMVLSIVVYALMWGWWFAAGFVVLMLVHECGHLVAARRCGLKVGMPVFIPFMGAAIALKEAPRNAWIEAQVGIGGPLMGAAGAFACLLIYEFVPNPFFLALAYAGFWLNLFNLIPIVPLDGGRVVTAISPWLWVAGLVLMVFVLLQSSFNFFVILIVGLSLPRVFALFRRQSAAERRFFELTPGQRALMSAIYFGLAGTLGWMMHATHAQIELLRAASY